MKKKLLFVIPSLGAGGAEKSLVNLLNLIDAERYEVDLFLFSTSGLFIKQLPNFVKVLPKSRTMETFQMPLGKSVKQFLIKGNWIVAWNRLIFAQIQRRYKNNSLAEQYSWRYFSKAIKPLSKEYDAAIGFLEKSSIYFVVDKIKADKKIGFIHNDYNQLCLDKIFDCHYFKYLSHIATVSDACVAVLRKQFPEYNEKVCLIRNIVSAELIKSLASLENPQINPNSIVSIGRLHSQKGFDLAVQAAAILKAKNISFHWYIIGEGSERPHLEALIQQYSLQDCFTLLGLRENPYPYIRQAEVFVQCSRYEGKSIALDEAKILAKPIVVTNFSTAKDQIENGVNGLIVEMNPEALSNGILRYFGDSIFREKIVSQLKSENNGTEQEIEKLYSLL